MAAEGITTVAAERCKAELSKLSIKLASETSHAAVMNAEGHTKVLAEAKVKGSQVKNLFLKDGKKKLYLVSMLHTREVSLKDIGVLIGASGGVRMEAPAAMEEATGCKPGSVTPLAVLNDAKKAIIYVLDKGLDTAEPVLVHPLTNEATIGIAFADLVRFITAHAADAPKVIDFGAAKKDEGAAKPAKEKAAKTAADKDGKAKADKPAADKDGKAKADKSAAAAAAKKAAADKKAASSTTSTAAADKGSEQKADEENLMGVQAKKADDFSAWYQQLVLRAEMIDYSDISGCYILRPWSFAIWDFIKDFIDAEIKKLGVKNSYFPLFISRRALEAEKAHIEGFAAEVAWVTHSGDSELNEWIAVRPTSETAMYPLFAKWVRSHRDLPLKLNQWANVVRWEFKNPTPFIRSREFLWQEGHTAFATKAEADEEVLQILDIYRRAYEELLAVPVVPGKKTEKEKFAGGDYTTTVEAYIPVIGRGCQAATSHMLGQNFAKMFHIEFENAKGGKSLAWQNSWGFTTRSIGVMTMTHSDDKGLVLPPRVAPTQVVLVPIFFKEKDSLRAECAAVCKELRAVGIRAEVDDRENYTPGWKFNTHELKGVPIRIEVGPKDVAAGRVTAVRRDDETRAKILIARTGLVAEVQKLLDDIQASLFAKAKKAREEHTKVVTTWAEFMSALDSRCIAYTPWCGSEDCENQVKQKSGEAAKEEQKEAQEAGEEAVEKLTGGAKSLCIPFKNIDVPTGCDCIAGCGKKATTMVLFGRSY